MRPEPRKKILVVDDEEYICRIIVESLAGENYDVVAHSNPSNALTYISANPIDLVLTDLVMGEFSGLQILETTLENHPDAVVILMTAHPTVQTAISVLKRGAYDFLVKPFKLELLNATIRRGLDHQKALRDNLSLKGQVGFLKVANNYFGSEQDIDKYLSLLLDSCNTELSAQASAIIEVDPVSGNVVREVCQSRSDEAAGFVLDNAHLMNFRKRAKNTPEVIAEPLSADGRQMFRTRITSPITILGRFHGIINVVTYSRYEWTPQGRLDVLSILAGSAASAIANHKLYRDLENSYLQAFRALANAIEARDIYTAGHTDRVTRLAELVARKLNWSEFQIQHLHMGCTLHDIGKIGVPDAILNKADRLTDEERDCMMQHPQVGLKIIRNIDLFEPCTPYIIAHHERYDGQGYPNGLRGEDIPIEGRLLAVVDTFDAIMSDRPYRKGAQLDIAVSELVNNAGKQFDPNLVRAFIDVLRAGEIDLKELYGRDGDLSCLDDISIDVTESQTVQV